MRPRSLAPLAVVIFEPVVFQSALHGTNRGAAQWNQKTAYAAK